MIIDIETSVALIKQTPAPILFIDTCSLLDIIRVPSHPNVKLSHLEGAKEAVKKAKSNSIYLVITETVEMEYKDNLSKTCVELERYTTKFAATGEKIVNSIECVELSYNFYISGIEEIRLAAELEKIANNVIDSSLILEENQECIHSAHERTKHYQAPAQRGKSESKDCVIIEHFLELSKRLREEGLTNPLIFITNNSSDYGKAPNPKPPLNLEFGNLDIAYCNNLKWALSLV
jgi:hypothetical protein